MFLIIQWFTITTLDTSKRRVLTRIRMLFIDQHCSLGSVKEQLK